MSLRENSKAQVPIAKKAAALKKAAEAKRPQPSYLQRPNVNAPANKTLPPTPERISEAHRSQGPPRLMSRREILALTGLTYPTVWKMMRAGTFPRARIVGGKSMWLRTEIDTWMAALPLRKLKGDSEKGESE